MAEIQIIEENADVLASYGMVSIAFTVETELRIERSDGGLGGLVFKEEKVDAPYRLDYDELDGEGPTRWLKQFDVNNWRVLSAFSGDKRIGGAVIVCRTPGVNMLEGRDNLAVLWDIRVNQESRGDGVGKALFQKCCSWAKENGCVELKIETQNVNVNACRFYAGQGALLTAVTLSAYDDMPGAAQLIWRITL